MPTDIYTRQPIVTKSEEHVLPKAFGGRLVIRGCVDKITNDRFGHGIDASLDEALRSIRIFLDARNSDGDPPRALHHVPGSDGKTYVVESGGVAMAPPNIVRTKLDGGALRIEGTVPNARSVRDMLRKHARRTGKDLEDLSAAFLSSATHQLTPPPTMTFGLHLWDSEPYRATAKVVCNLLAERDAELFLAPEFDDIRAYVLDGVELSEHPVQAVSVDLTPDGLGPLDHFVKVDVNAAGDVVGLVIYFGLLAFAVRLGRSRRRPQFSRSYRVDQLARSDREDDPRDLALEVPSFADGVARPFEEFLTLVRSQMERLVPTLSRLQRDIWLDRLIRPHWQNLLAQTANGDALTSDQLLAFSNAVSKQVVAELAPHIVEASKRRCISAEAQIKTEAPSTHREEPPSR